MYCRYCGTQLADGTAYCIKCGKKTVKLRPRVQEAPPPPPPPAPLTGADRLKAETARLLSGIWGKVWPRLKGLPAVLSNCFAFTKEFNAAMWAICGVFLGFEIVALIEVISSVNESALLFGFLREVPTVLLLAWLLCLIIAQVTLICAYNYKQTDEYKNAVAKAVRQAPVPVVPASIAEDFSIADGAEAGDDAPPVAPEAAEDKPALSAEAADIFAELEKLSLTL